jgi:2-polyprenyl-3-methyl-5-hydroxy-6-metoxy-1,4-benzoquinol methylase
MPKLYPARVVDNDIAFSFLLGADISRISPAYRSSNDELLKALAKDDAYLIVSTIEPRKNHSLLLDAFDALWEQFPSIKLCFIGKEGWMIEDVVKRVRTHPMLNKRIFWFEGLTDKDVQWAYRNAKCVLFPSFQEGFGLPIVEALYSGTPVLASDIPVFHEVAGDNIGYFDPNDPQSLVDWIEKIEQHGIPSGILPDKKFQWTTWKESAEELIHRMLEADKAARVRLQPLLETYSFNQRVAIEAIRMKGIEMKTEYSRPIPKVTVDQMMKMDGKELIRTAYDRFLHRAPSRDEESHWNGLLLSGLPVISLIADIRFSQEGRTVAEPVKHPKLLRRFGRWVRKDNLRGKIAKRVLSLRYPSDLKQILRNVIIREQDQSERIDQQSKHIDQQSERIDQLASSLQAEIKANAFPELPFSMLLPTEPYLKNAEGRVGKPAPLDDEGKQKEFYTYYSEIGGNSINDILLQHHMAYLPHIDKNLAAIYPFLDIGCGNGEFLSFLNSEGIKTVGIDIDSNEIARCNKRGLVAYCDEAIEYLKKHDEAYCGISMLQVIEHMEHSSYIKLLSLIKRRLANGGLLIAETINPFHASGLGTFYIDPTHTRPVSPEYLAFLAQWCGFAKVDILYLYPVLMRHKETYHQYYYFDYAVLAKKGDNE